jgi:hypothetical protein
MKSRRKHELQTNELADALGRLIERARPHAQTIAIVAGVVVIAAVLLVWLPIMRGQADEVAAASFNMAVRSGTPGALRTFLDQHAEAEQAPAARLLLADRLLDEVAAGKASEAEEPDRAAEMLAEAETLYTQVAGASPDLQAQARVGLALVTLQRGKVAEGRKALEQVTEQWPQSVGAARAKAHLGALAGYKPMEFSDEPLEEPSAPDEPGAEAAEKPASEPPAGQESPAAPAEEKPAPEKPEAPKASEPPAAPNETEKPSAEPASTPEEPAGEAPKPVG